MNLNRRYEFRNQNHTLENILFEIVKEMGRNISSSTGTLRFRIPDIVIDRNDNSEIRNGIMTIDPKKRREMRINKSTLWY